MRDYKTLQELDFAPHHIIERQELPRGYARVIYKCKRCERRIARLSLLHNQIIGFKSAETFPRCPYCEEANNND